MSFSPPQQAGIHAAHAQVQEVLAQALRHPHATDDNLSELNQSLFDLEKAVEDFGLVKEVHLLGDNISNEHVFSLLNNALPGALKDLHYQILLGINLASPYSEAQKLQHRDYSDIVRYFLFSTKAATKLIHHLHEHSQSNSTVAWIRSREARASLRQFVKELPIWPPLPNFMQEFTSLDSEDLLPSRYNIWTSGITILHKLESSWQQGGYHEIPENDRALCELRHALFWFSISDHVLISLERRGIAYRQDYSLHALRCTTEAVKFILSTMKSIWLLDRFELSSAFAWLPRKVRGMSTMLLHQLAERIDRFFRLGLAALSLSDIDRFGDFSIQMKVKAVEEASRGMTNLWKTSSSVEDRRRIPPDVPTPRNTSTHSAVAVSPSSTVNNGAASSEDMFRINNDMEGLQIVEAEMASPLPEPVLLPKSALTSVSLRHPNEVEMPNLECSDPGRSRGGFLHGVLSLDTTAPRNQGYMKSHVRVMKNFSPSDSYVRVCTSRHQAPFHEVKALLSLVELVPSYAFLDENDCEYPLFLRSAGLTLGLTYKVKCVDNPSESALDLYGLQGALIGATFEVQYPAKSILLHRKGKSAAERLRSAKVQMWTDSKELTSAPDGPGPATGSSNEGPTSPRHRAIPLDSSDEDVEATKIYLYSQHCIYVLFVSDRIVATKQPSAKKLISRTQPTTLSLTPNKLKGISSIRVRVIEGDSRSPAGIPIDHTKLRFAGQDTAAFAEFQSLQIEFPSSEVLSQCYNDFHDFLGRWRDRRRRSETFKANERNVRLHWKSKFTKGPRPASIAF